MLETIKEIILKDFNPKCECCGEKIQPYFRFTDWENEMNDFESDNLDEVIQKYIENIKEDESGNFSIYDLSNCNHCDNSRDEGIFYNNN